MKNTRYWSWVLLVYLCSFSAHSDNIVFDIFGVLVEIPTSQKIRNTGVLDSLGYMFHEGKDITFLKSDFMNMLGRVKVVGASSVSESKATAQGLLMPNIMVAWQRGDLAYTDALKLINEELEQSRYTFYEKNLFRSASHLAFDLETRKNSYRLIDRGVEIVRRLHGERDAKGQRRHQLYILSNMDDEMMHHLEAAYPDVFGLFDGKVHSAEAKSLKPDPAIYATLLERYHLEPKNTWMVDDQRENIDAAVALGFKGIVCTSHRQVALEFERVGLMTSNNKGYVQFKTALAAAGIIGFIVGATNF